MYAGMTLIPIKPGMREEIDKVADSMLSVLRGMKGFKSATFIVNPDGNECGAFVVWESQEDAEAAWVSTGPKMQEVMTDIAMGPPARRMFEVYKPKV